MKRTFIFTVLAAVITLVATSCDQPMTSVVEPDLEADLVSEKVQAFLDAGGEIHVPSVRTLRMGEGEPPTCWVTEIGENLNMSDDQAVTLALPFPFTFYGVTYPEMYVSSNGIITLNASNSSCCYPAIPFNEYVMIAPLFGDFNPYANDGEGGANDVFYNVVGIAPNRQVVVTWNVVPEYPNTGINTFQVILTEGSMDILFGYNGLTTDGINWNGPEMKVGIANGTASYIAYASGTEIPALDGTNLLYTWNGQDYDVSTSCVPEFPGPPPNADPVADAGEDQTLECVGPDGTSVTLDGSVSSDPDGDDLTYSWTDGNGDEVSTEASFTTALGLGTHTFTLTVDDGNGGTASDEVVVTVEDTTPPEITVAETVASIWPPNGDMHLVASGIAASDICCDVTLAVSVVAGDASVNGSSDIVANDDGTYDVYVEALRDGSGSGTYTISVAAIDCADNAASLDIVVTVPHDRGRRQNNRVR